MENIIHLFVAISNDVIKDNVIRPQMFFFSGGATVCRMHIQHYCQKSINHRNPALKHILSDPKRLPYVKQKANIKPFQSLNF